MLLATLTCDVAVGAGGMHAYINAACAVDMCMLLLWMQVLCIKMLRVLLTCAVAVGAGAVHVINAARAVDMCYCCGPGIVAQL